MTGGRRSAPPNATTVATGGAERHSERIGPCLYFWTRWRGGRLQRDPGVLLRAGYDGFDDAHVADGVGEGRRDGGVVEDRPGEKVALDRVLVADVEGDLLDVAPALVPHQAGAVGRGVEGDLDLDAAL